MILPEMKVPPTEKPISCWAGKHAECCSKCRLHGVHCSGCNRHRDICEQRTCYRECYDCGNRDDRRFAGLNTPSVCIKSPYFDLCLTQVLKDVDQFKFKTRPLIELKNHGIIINQGSPGRYRDGQHPYPDDAELVAVNLRHVWSTRGWFSYDMKDYLHLPPNTKLFLLTSVHDDVLHRAWEAEIYDDDFKKLGFDYWQGLEFSDYEDHSFGGCVWEGYRSLRSIEVTKAHFGTYKSGMMLASPTLFWPVFKKLAQAVPQFTFNLASQHKEESVFRFYLARIKKFVEALDIKSAWFIGVVSAQVAYNIQRVIPSCTCYFLASNPWLAAHKGDEFMATGKLRKSSIPRLELVLRNQRNYVNLINDAVAAARMSGGKQKTPHKKGGKQKE